MPGVFRRRPRFTSRRGLPWLGVAAATNPGVTNLVAWWTLNETEGNSRLDSHTSSYDLTENSGDATGVASATGKISNAASFLASNTEYLSRASHEAALSASGGFYFGCWFKSGLTGFQRIAGQFGASNGGSTSSWLLYTNASGVPIARVAYGTNANREATWGSSATDDSWHFVEMYYSTADDEVVICVDRGTDVATSTSGDTIQQGSEAFQIGYCNGAYTDGEVDEACFFSSVLTTANRDWLYNTTTGRTYSELDGATVGGVVVPVWAIYAGAAT